MEFSHFKTAAQFGRVGVNARLAQRLALYRRLAAKALAELARERGIDDLFQERKDFTCAYCGLHRYHLPGQHDQCDHSPTGECSEEDIMNDVEETPAGANFEQWNKKLTSEERFAVVNYSSGDIEFFPNDELRTDQKLSPAKARITKNLDSIIDRYPLPASLTVYRGMHVNDDFLQRISQQKGFLDKGFVSASRSSAVANDFVMSSETIGWGGKDGKSIMMKISLPKGFKAAPIERMVASGYEDQREVLLPRNTIFTIKKISQKGGLEILGGRKSGFTLIEVEARYVS